MASYNSLLLWEKLRTVPYNKNIEEALRCEIHDPLWLLARQWQMGEFNADDAGTAAFATIQTQSTPPQHIHADGPAVQPSNIQERPLNAIIENIPAAFDVSLSLETGRWWKRMLVSAGKTAEWELYCQQSSLRFTIPSFTYDPENKDLLPFHDETYEQMTAALSNGRMVNGAALFAAVQKGKASALINKTDAALDELGVQWRIAVQKLLGLPGTIAWDASRLEYRAETSAALADQKGLYLQMPEHHGGVMDSFTWQQRIGAAPETAAPFDNALVQRQRKTFIPTPVTYPGMPRARWWEFEDSTIDLAGLQTRKTDIGLLVLAEFGLMYSNDWLITPLTLPVGYCSRVKSLRVTDVFGVQSIVPPVLQNSQWEMFQVAGPAMNYRDRWLYIPPVANHYLQSAIQEEVRFTRDEMANLVWAVETTVPNGLGEGTEGRSAALRQEEWLLKLAGTPPAPVEGTGNDQSENIFKYRIGNTVPAHWIPFVPFRINNANAQMVLRRAAMPRFADNKKPTRIRPKTTILQSNSSTNGQYNIQEEEIPATGATIRQYWRRSRWFDGNVVTWLAREKTIGRNLESSGLQFDIVD